MRARSLLAVTVMSALLAACTGGSGGPEVRQAMVGAPAGPNAALYFTAIGGGEDDRLLGARSDVAAEIQIHETIMEDDGTMTMAPIAGIDLPAGDEIVLEPGGYHLMLIDVERLQVGDEVDVTLVWEKAGEMTVSAEVVDPADTMGDHG